MRDLPFVRILMIFCLGGLAGILFKIVRLESLDFYPAPRISRLADASVRLHEFIGVVLMPLSLSDLLCALIR